MICLVRRPNFKINFKFEAGKYFMQWNLKSAHNQAVGVILNFHCYLNLGTYLRLVLITAMLCVTIFLFSVMSTLYYVKKPNKLSFYISRLSLIQRKVEKWRTIHSIYKCIQRIKSSLLSKSLIQLSSGFWITVFFKFKNRPFINFIMLGILFSLISEGEV